VRVLLQRAITPAIQDSAPEIFFNIVGPAAVPAPSLAKPSQLAPAKYHLVAKRTRTML